MTNRPFIEIEIYTKGADGMVNNVDLGQAAPLEKSLFCVLMYKESFICHVE